jgi:hypothetical protein
VHAARESAAAELLDLGLVLAANVGVSEDEDVVQVLVGVGERKVGRAGEERRVRTGLSLAVVAEDELLMEDGRVVVAWHLYV